MTVAVTSPIYAVIFLLRHYSRLSISWRLVETRVEIETKVFGDFLLLILFSSPLPLLLNFVRQDTFTVYFSILLTRERRKVALVEVGGGGGERGDGYEEGVLMTLIATADPGKCAQLEEYRSMRER